MSIVLPTDIAAEDQVPYLIDFGGSLEPYLGGVTQRIDRLGSRWGLEVSLPPLDAEEARVWFSRLVQAKREDALLPWPQVAGVGAEGAPRVNGAGQNGTALSVDGLPASKAVKEGWFFSLIAGGRRYLHLIAADATASVGGAVTLTIEPELRVIPPDNAVIELAAPIIEGELQGDTVRMSINLLTDYGFSFVIAERA